MTRILGPTCADCGHLTSIHYLFGCEFLNDERRPCPCPYSAPPSEAWPTDGIRTAPRPVPALVSAVEPEGK